MSVEGEAYHRVRQGLVAIAEAAREPAGRLLDGLVGPLPVGQVDGLEGRVLLRGVLEPGVAGRVSIGLIREKTARWEGSRAARTLPTSASWRRCGSFPGLDLNEGGCKRIKTCLTREARYSKNWVSTSTKSGVCRWTESRLSKVGEKVESPAGFLGRRGDKKLPRGRRLYR